MRKNKKQASLSKAAIEEEIAEFWDSYSLADYWNQSREAEFEVRTQHRRRITLDPEIYERVKIQARTRGISPEKTLINLW